MGFFFDFEGTQPNPNFLDDFRSQVTPALNDGNKVLILVDGDLLGTLTPSSFFPHGKPSNALRSAFVLLSNGECVNNRVLFLEDSFEELARNGVTMVTSGGDSIDPEQYLRLSGILY
mmetsp:Transcript_32815/g.64072  ORF Transcript_32815/g.64072 Transcript_32815/m.64072 type:complete len:117 (-) Transcript_32815:27-377(-)